MATARILAWAVMLWAVSGSELHAASKVAFVTSVTGTGDLSSWADAGGQTGVAAGDAICQARAQAAGLANPSSFVAWLSDSSTDAYCRVHNLTGTRATNCGQPTLPVAAGPWVGVDGHPFAASIDRMLAPEGVVYAPVGLDELGNPQDSFYFTDTSDTGVYWGSASQACADWTAASGLVVRCGDADKTTSGWTQGGGTLCSSSIRLLCLETGAGTALPPFWKPGARAFVTSVTGTGDLGSWPDAGGATGTEAGDQVCQARAVAAGLGDPDSFFAWLSDGSSDVISRISYTGAWTRMDGMMVAQDRSDLSDGTLFSPINMTELGEYLGNEGVYTGTDVAGTSTGLDCDGWLEGTTAADATAGSAYNAGGYWTDVTTAVCSANYRLYCLSESDVDVFSDGFESSDTAAWSASVG